MVSKSAPKGPDIHIVDPLVEWPYFGIMPSGVHVVSSLADAHTCDYKFKADLAEALFMSLWFFPPSGLALRSEIGSLAWFIEMYTIVVDKVAVHSMAPVCNTFCLLSYENFLL